MENIEKHIKIATMMNKSKLDLELIEDFSIKALEEVCIKIQEANLNTKIYDGNVIIQKELITNMNSIKYLIRFYNENIQFKRLSELLKNIQNNNEKITDYSVENIMKILKDSDFNKDISYIYLKYFSDKIRSRIGKKVVMENLKYFLHDPNNKIEDINNEQLRLFTKPYLANYNLMTRNDIKKIYELLVQNDELEKLIYFLFKNKLYLELNMDDYKKLNKNAKEIKEYISKIASKIDNETLYRLLLKWNKNGCTLYDLKILQNRINNMETSKLENVVNSRSGYINFIFGNKISNMKLNNLNEVQEDLIIYAIRNNKKGFLKLIEQNQEEFLRIPSYSIIYDEEIYSKYLNINSINKKNLKEARYLSGNSSYFYLLDEDFKCTFSEIKTLYNSKYKSYYILYNTLKNLKVDERLIIIKQLINKNLLNQFLKEENIKKLGEMLRIKSLYNWIEQDFSHIQNINPNITIRALIDYEFISKFINEIQDVNELSYLLRNKDRISQYNKFQDIKDNIEKIDKSWQELADSMNLKDEFIEKNKNNIKQFLLKNGAEIALTYYNKLSSDVNRKAYKLIVKSELMGEFDRLKYFSNDLNKEISFNLNKSQIEEWTRNKIKIVNEDIIASEYDDFFYTMILGLEPMRTCLCYIDGMYNKCLLACFDSNKKILYAKINDKIVGRAMIRLTKGSYKNNKKTNSLTFVDLENIENDNLETSNKDEILTIFLERPYISGVSPQITRKIEETFIKIVEGKAKRLNALLVLSNSYERSVDEEYIYTKYYMYISKSKAGSQYLDSLSGEASISDEGQYRVNNFFIWNPDEKQEKFYNLFDT